ncbi:hypothetical protein H0H93_011191 [Arthromyces matolae]|nr:hypothetical protein H0H93_011191 [Arthromyces matolae]
MRSSKGGKRKFDSHYAVYSAQTPLDSSTASTSQPIRQERVLHANTTAVVTSKGTQLSTTAVQAFRPSVPLPPPPPLRPSKVIEDLVDNHEFLQPGYFDSWDNDHERNSLPRHQRSSDNPMNEFRSDREWFLSELLRGEGRVWDNASCKCGSSASAEYRCVDCLHGELLCKMCMVRAHMALPFHRIEEWNGTFFETRTLKSLGLRIQLNHPPGETCLVPKPAPGDDFVVVDVFHTVEIGVDFCECERSTPHFVQLLRSRLYPTTSTYPRSAITFNCLKHFQLLSFESKCSGYEYMSAINRGTDNTGVSKPRDRYDEFMRSIRQWRHLKMLKRSGRGHDPLGVPATKEGECAVICPACPQPDANLPPDWKSAPPEKKFLYALFVAIDANFRLKRRCVSSEQHDPSLSEGWSFFVNEEPYKKHITTTWNHKQPKSTCVSHNAVNNPDKEARGLAASGVGTVDCARHDFKRPRSVGDLQLGEKYINMDYLVLLGLKDTEIEILKVSYDIVCQWHVLLREQMMSYPHHLHLGASIKHITFLVPKFHLAAHIEACNLLFSFRLANGVGRTDGEAPERGWANINLIAQSTKEMGPGSRRDTIDDFFNDSNWKKTTKFGPQMLKKIREAASSFQKHTAAMVEFNDAIPDDVRNEWEEQVKKWEENSTLPNPYQNSVKGMPPLLNID